MTKIKICGLRRPCDVEYANRLKLDYVGFVFTPKSSRCISAETAFALRSELDSEICPVGVFVNAQPESVARLLEDGVIDMAQLHGQEDSAYIRHLKGLTNKPLIKAFSIHCAEDARASVNAQTDYILLDNGNGGTGKSFDWSLTTDVSRSYFLAGGLSAENIGQALRETAPYAVDVSSGVETDGYKDYEKMHRFVQAVRGN